MTPLDAALGIVLVALCAHVGILLVSIGRALLPQRWHRARRISLAAGTAALVGELLVLRGLVGAPASPPFVLGALGLALLLGILARDTWREHNYGRAAFHAVIAAPLVLIFVVVLTLR